MQFAHAEQNLSPADTIGLASPETELVPATSPEATSEPQPLILDSSEALSENFLEAPPSIDLWQRIRSGFAMPELDSQLIARHEQWYSSRPEYMARMSERSQRYLFYIIEEVEKRGMPSEIALLPMIESAFNPGAFSVSKASGIWQFIPSTGKNFGLHQNWWYDGRRDIMSATNSALDYLEKLHAQFGDWELALAAYNWGEGAVARAQMRNRKQGKPTNYASLKLPPETQNYVPKLLAIKNIINDPARFGLKLPDIANQPYFVAVSLPPRLDVKMAAELANVSLEEFIALNPGHNRPLMLQESSQFILLPADKVETFQTNLENTDQPLSTWQTYKTKKGERFDQVAPRFGLSVDKLRKINGLSLRARVSNGQTLLVPRNNEDNENIDFSVFNYQQSSPEESALPIKHTVRKGENLVSIARHYHVTLAQLKQWNVGLQKIVVGQRITVVKTAHSPHRLVKNTNRAARLAKVNKRRNINIARHQKTSHSSPKKKVRVASTR